MKKLLALKIAPPTSETFNEETLKVNRRILVVEDEMEIQKAYSSILSPEELSSVVPIRRSSRQTAKPLTAEEEKLPQAQIPPYDLVICSTAEEALDQVKKAKQQGCPFALGFIDVLLGGGMDGIELVRRIQEFDSEMYFVFVTAYQDRSVQSIHELLGPVVAERWDYLNKPFSEGEIVQKARSSVSHWNLKNEKTLRDQQISEIQRKMWEAERLVSVATISRSMGHEFGNILTQIMGRAELAKRKSESEMRQAFEQIMRASELAGQVLDRFKNLSQDRPAGTATSLFCLDKPLEEALLLMDHQLKNANIKMTKVKMDPALVAGHSGSLTQVIVNLLINSIYAMKSSGQIDLSILRTEEGSTLVVRDYGPGIPPSSLPEVTKPFFTTKGNQGTGLGLSICKEIVEIEHLGEFKIENHPVKGVVVTLAFPPPRAGGER